MSINERIVDVFELLRQRRETEGEPYRARAYSRAIETIRALPYEIVSGQQASTLPGIGKSLTAKIDEIIETGTVEELKGEGERQAVIDQLMTIDGVGPVTANRWYDEGVRSFDDLRPDMLTRAQKISLAFREDFAKPIPRAEIEQFERELARCLSPRGIRFDIAGSYRRGLKQSNDIDILVVEQPGVDAMAIVTNCPGFEPNLTLAYGPKKYRGVAKIADTYRRVDVELVRPEEYPFALMYFTGPATFNIKLRAHAAENGLTLNEKGLFGPEGEFYPAQSEEELLYILGIEQLSPSQRNAY